MDMMIAGYSGSTLLQYDRDRLARVVSMLDSLFSAFSMDEPAAASSPADINDVLLSRNGDHDAFRRLVERHQPAVSRLLWRFTRDRNEHEELSQQAFVQAFLSLPGYRGEAPFQHWLARIATRVGYRYWNHSRRTKSLPLANEIPYNDPSIADANDSERAAELLHSLLAQLPPKDRLALTLRYLQGCDVSQAAYRSGWTQTLVRVRTHRAIARLKKLIIAANIRLDDYEIR